MISQMIRTSVLAAICAAAVTSVAVARTIYDGEWSVLIVTESGGCDRAYRYGVQISDGVVVYQGGGPIVLTGRVANNGTVRVNVSGGDRRAAGSGRLSRNAGQGSWSGNSSSSGTCAGYWTAERRG
jgi:hypothetical protein